MLEILARDLCESSASKAPTTRFCYQKMQFCCVNPTVGHLANGTTQVSVCLFDTAEEILAATGGDLRIEEQEELRKIWAEDAFPRKFELVGDCLHISGDFENDRLPSSPHKGSLRESLRDGGNLMPALVLIPALAGLLS